MSRFRKCLEPRGDMLLGFVAIGWVALTGMAFGAAEPYFGPATRPEHAVTHRKFTGIPSLCVTPKGRLWATWYAGPTPAEDSNNYIVLSTSTDGGETWREVLIADPDGDGPSRYFDANLWVTPDGRLQWNWAERRPGFGGKWGVKGDLTSVRYGDDPESDTMNWTKPISVGTGVAMGKTVRLSTGEWAMPVCEWFAAPSAFMYVSTDGGTSWTKRGGCTFDETARRFDEHMFVENANGDIQLWARTNQGMGWSVSHDRGRTWARGMGLTIAHTEARFFVTRLKSGRLLLVKHGPMQVFERDYGNEAWWEPGKREKLMAFVSEDDGVSWKGGLMIDARDNVSYPDGQQAADGSIHLIHDRERTKAREILCSRFTEEDVLAKKLVSAGSYLKKIVSKGSYVEPPVKLPDGPVASATVGGVSGREPKVGAGAFFDRDYLLAALPKPFDGLNILPVDMEGEKTLEVTAAGNLFMLTPKNPDNRGADLARQGFRKLEGTGSEFALFTRKKQMKPSWGTIYPTQEQAREQNHWVEVWYRACKAGDKVTFAKWALPLVRCETKFVKTLPAARPYAGAASRVRPKHVVIVGLDGFAGVHFDKAKLPNLNALRKTGAWSLNQRSINPTFSACNWHSFFTCCGKAEHGYDFWDTQTPAAKPKAVTARGYTPDFVSEFRASRPDAKIDYIFEWVGMDFTADCAAATLSTNVPYAARAATELVVARIKGEKPDLLYVHYDNPDSAGHKHGWGSPGYIAGCEEVDACLGRIISAIKDAGIWNETVLVVLSDHGGKDKGHGGTSEDEYRGITFFAGKGVKAGVELPRANIYDTGATVAALLGITPPAVWIGQPLDKAFDR